MITPLPLAGNSDQRHRSPVVQYDGLELQVLRGIGPKREPTTSKGTVDGLKLRQAQMLEVNAVAAIATTNDAVGSLRTALLRPAQRGVRVGVLPDREVIVAEPHLNEAVLSSPYPCHHIIAGPSEHNGLPAPEARLAGGSLHVDGVVAGVAADMAVLHCHTEAGDGVHGADGETQRVATLPGAERGIGGGDNRGAGGRGVEAGDGRDLDADGVGVAAEGNVGVMSAGNVRDSPLLSDNGGEHEGLRGSHDVKFETRETKKGT